MPPEFPKLPKSKNIITKKSLNLTRVEAMNSKENPESRLKLSNEVIENSIKSKNAPENRKFEHRVGQDIFKNPKISPHLDQSRSVAAPASPPEDKAQTYLLTNTAAESKLLQIQILGGNHPSDQSDEEQNSSGPATDLIGPRPISTEDPGLVPCIVKSLDQMKQEVI